MQVPFTVPVQVMMLAATDPWLTPGAVTTWAGALAIIAAEFIRHFKERRKDSATSKAGDPNAIKQISRIDEEIHERLAQLRLHSKACRVIVYLFHNGEQYFNGGPIQRMTCSYESVQGGTARIMDDQKGVATSMMSGFLAKMDDDTPVINRTEDLLDAYCRTMLEDLSVTHFACLPLHQTPQKIIGCLQVHWFAKNDKPDSQRVDDPGYKEWFEGEVKTTVFQIQHNLGRRLTISGVHTV